MKKSTSRLVALALSVMMMITMIAPASAATYESSYATKQEAIDAGALLNLQIASEGMVLLKNENKALPLTENAKISVFGYASIAPQGGGEISGDTSAGIVKLQSDIYSSLNDAGIEINPIVKGSYEAWKDGGEIANDADISNSADFEIEKAKWDESYTNYGDAGVVVFSDRSSAERDHILQYDQAQYDLIDYVASKFDKVIVLINSSRPYEISAIASNEAVDAILVVSEPGDNGFDALGLILTGAVNPSGRTTDTWAVDFTKDPTYVNYNIASSSDARGNSIYTVNGEETNTFYVEYEEGIYLGYRYYETRGHEEAKAGNESWYAENVVYPFGHGLSYTTFDWAVKPMTAADSVITKDSELTFEVTVTNTGDVAGKDVVQLYYTAPYGEATTNPTKLEKAHVVLGDFAKTKELAPGESETLTLTIKASEMASYDYVTDKTYVLDDGAYAVKLSRNSHDVVASVNYTVAAKELCNLAATTGYEVTNQFDEVTEGYLATTDMRLSRADFEGTFPTAAPKTRDLSTEEFAAWAWVQDDKESDPWYTDVMPTYANEETRPEQAEIMLADMVGKDYDDPIWEKLLDQLTLQEMADLINYGGFHSINIDYIGKPYSHDTDGPKGWTGSGVDTSHNFNKFAAEPMIGGTFNKELVYQLGVMIGEQGLWGNATLANGMAYNYTGWYAPGMNIHRSPFEKRYPEYYSEDPFLTGTMGANMSLGAKSKGCYVALKHFAFFNDGGGTAWSRNPDGTLNIGGGYRGGPEKESGMSVWIDEQTAREIYLKGFQIAVEEGGATFAMASFTRIGTTWCGGSYALNTNILRNEWGFNGAIVTDIAMYGYLNCDQMIRAGVDMLLEGGMGGGYVTIGSENAAAYDATQVAAMRNATKHILYMVANSNAMQLPKGAKVVYTMPTTVNAEGDTEVLQIPAATAGEAYETPALNTATLNTFGPFAEITYAAENLPEGLAFDAATGVISGTATTAGTYTVTVTAAAEGYESASVDYTIEVK